MESACTASRGDREALRSTHAVCGLPRWRSAKEPASQCRRHRRLGFNSLVGKILEKEMATHSRILAWKVPWTEEPGGLQSMRSERVGHE